MITNQLLDMLRCPQDHSKLSRAASELVERANQGIEAGWVVNSAGVQVERRIDGGLLRAAADVMYPVVDGIPVMLPDESIELSQLEGAQFGNSRPESAGPGKEI